MIPFSADTLCHADTSLPDGWKGMHTDNVQSVTYGELVNNIHTESGQTVCIESEQLT